MLSDLLSAAEPVGNNQRVLRRPADGREQDALASFDTDLEPLSALEPEAPRHTAAARVKDLEVEAQHAKQGLLVAEPEHRLVVAMAMNHGSSFELRWFITLPHQEFAEQKRLRRESSRVRVIGKQIDQLISEDGHAARLQPNHGHPTTDKRPDGPECALQHTLRQREHPVVVERAAAAHPTVGDEHAI